MKQNILQHVSIIGWMINCSQSEVTIRVPTTWFPYWQIPGLSQIHWLHVAWHAMEPSGIQQIPDSRSMGHTVQTFWWFLLPKKEFRQNSSMNDLNTNIMFSKATVFQKYFKVKQPNELRFKYWPWASKWIWTSKVFVGIKRKQAFQ